MDRGAWWATVHGVAKSWMQLTVHILVRMPACMQLVYLLNGRRKGDFVWFFLLGKIQEVILSSRRLIGEHRQNTLRHKSQQDPL